MSPRDSAVRRRGLPAIRPTAATPFESFGDVGISPLSTLPATLKSQGIDPAPLLRQAGVAPDLFEVPTNRAPLGAMTRLMELCVQATGKPHFGLLVGRQFELPMLGPLGEMMGNESSVGAALRRLVLDLRMHDRSAIAALDMLGDRLAGLSYAVCTPGTPAVWLADDTSIMIGCRILASLCGPKWRPVEVLLAHSKPVDHRPYRELFGAPVRFDVPLSMLVFERRWLDSPVVGADPARLCALDRAAARDAGAQRFADLVRRVLRSSVMTNQHGSESIAELFSISPRTLRRRLADDGATLHALVVEARLLVAQQLLEQTRLPVSEIAAALHYSDITAFSRAFRGWTGIPPSAWRQSA
jgi:AraC-like DNA-binding protein